MISKLGLITFASVNIGFGALLATDPYNYNEIAFCGMCVLIIALMIRNE